MDWLLDPRRDEAVASALEEVEAHLLRHATDQASVPAAVEAAGKALRSAAGEEPLWLQLDWTRIFPTLLLTPVGDTGFGNERSALTSVPLVQRAALAATTAGEPTTAELIVPRDVAVSFDPDAGNIVDIDPLRDGMVSVSVALAAAGETHPVASPDQVAAAAGTTLADAVLHGTDPTSADQVAELFIRLHDAIGGSATAIVVEDDRIELAVDRSPFGGALRQVPSLCRLSEAMLGRFAARLQGTATVVHDESLALGDPECRLQAFLGAVGEDVVGSTYQWPPAGIEHRPETSPRLEMTVSLPRQSHSVPVIRRLSAQILRAFGAASDSIHDVELAISEACANVIQHAADSEGYEVSIELAAQRCAITVLDRGDGFDPAGIEAQQDFEAESGRGLSLMGALVDNLNFVSEPKVGAVVHMVKQLDYDQDHPFRRTGPA